MPTWQPWYNGRRCGQRSTTTGDYYIAHSMQYARSRWCTAYCTPLQQLRFWIHLMTVSMLNTAQFQYLKRQDQQISKTCKSTFIFCSSWNLWEGAYFLHLACQHPCPPSVTPLPTVEKCRPPSSGDFKGGPGWAMPPTDFCLVPRLSLPVFFSYFPV